MSTVGYDCDSEDDIFQGIGVEITLSDRESFLKVRETLTRMGVVQEEYTLEQSCYILHKQGRYVITHYKELMWLDGEDIWPTDVEFGVRNRVAQMLDQFKLVNIVDPVEAEEPLAPRPMIRVIKYAAKNQWDLRSMYNIGQKRVTDGFLDVDRMAVSP